MLLKQKILLKRDPTFLAFEKPEGVPAVGKFSNTLRFIVKEVIRESAGNTQAGDRPFYDYLDGCLRHKAEMVIFEAARAITELHGVTNRELTPAITVLQLFLSSSKPVLRFAAVRTLNKVAMTHPTQTATLIWKVKHCYTGDPHWLIW